MRNKCLIKLDYITIISGFFHISNNNDADGHDDYDDNNNEYVDNLLNYGDNNDDVDVV